MPWGQEGGPCRPVSLSSPGGWLLPELRPQRPQRPGLACVEEVGAQEEGWGGGHSSTNQMPSWLRLGLPAHCVLSPQPAGRGGGGGVGCASATHSVDDGTQAWKGCFLRSCHQYRALSTQTSVCQTLQPDRTDRQPLPGRRVEDQTEAACGGNGGGQWLGREALGHSAGWPGF